MAVTISFGVEGISVLLQLTIILAPDKVEEKGWMGNCTDVAHF